LVVRRRTGAHHRHSVAEHRPDRARYLAALDQAGVAAIGFGTGLSHPSVPADLVTAADELGLPLFEVPLPTPFTAVAKRVMRRLAEQ